MSSMIFNLTAAAAIVWLVAGDFISGKVASLIWLEAGAVTGPAKATTATPTPGLSAVSSTASDHNCPATGEADVLTKEPAGSSQMPGGERDAGGRLASSVSQSDTAAVQAQSKTKGPSEPAATTQASQTTQASESGEGTRDGTATPSLTPSPSATSTAIDVRDDLRQAQTAPVHSLKLEPGVPEAAQETAANVAPEGASDATVYDVRAGGTSILLELPAGQSFLTPSERSLEIRRMAEDLDLMFVSGPGR